MLPNFYCQCYQQFKQVLQQLLQQTAAVTPLDTSRLRQGCLDAQQFFQQQIISLETQDLVPADQSKVQSYQTEMSKQLRLLTIDVMFLQAARQPETTQERKLQLEQRLNTLISYCDTLING